MARAAHHYSYEHVRAGVLKRSSRELESSEAETFSALPRGSKREVVGASLGAGYGRDRDIGTPRLALTVVAFEELLELVYNLLNYLAFVSVFVGVPRRYYESKRGGVAKCNDAPGCLVSLTIPAGNVTM